MHTFLHQAQALQDDLRRIRRQIHMHPELGFDLFNTAGLVSRELHALGIEHETGIGISGIVAHLGSGDGPVIAVRADMDALPITEANDVPYRSQIDGRMHACGHDAHTTMLLGTAMLLKDHPLRGEIRLLFQPSEEASDEEGLSGAPRMIADGALAGVDAVIALHVDGTTETGKIKLKSGLNTAAVDTVYARVIGRGGHGAHPHEARDPIFMTAPVLTALHGIVSRWVDPTRPAVVTVGRIAGGSVDNVIPDAVEFELTLRSVDDPVREQLITEVEAAFSIARSLGGDYNFRVVRGYPAMHNDPAVTEAVRAAAAGLIGEENIVPAQLTMGAEDFAFMNRAAPGMMFDLGVRQPGDRPRYLHTPDFDLDEGALPIGSALLAESVLKLLAVYGTG